MNRLLDLGNSGGPYTILLSEGGPGTITFTCNSTATCPVCNRTTSKISPVTLKPEPELKRR